MDVAAPVDALIDIWQGASAGALATSIESDGRFAFEAPQGFRVRANIIEIGTLEPGASSASTRQSRYQTVQSRPSRICCC